MTKTHVHIPSGKHDYKFRIEQRAVLFASEYRGRFTDLIYVVIEDEKRFELAPWFNVKETALEMAEKSTRGDQFCNAIPCVAYGTPVPRPDGSWFRPQEYSGISKGEK